MAGVRTALVTGGAGFVGSHLAERLLAEGYGVRVLDSLVTGREENVAHLDGAELVVADLRDADAVGAAAAGCELIFHQAAMTSVPRSFDEPTETLSTNVEGTLNVLLAARDAGVRRLVVASSSSVYGPRASLPCREEAAPDPVSPYAVSKLAAEGLCGSIPGVEPVLLRYFNVFGPRQDPASAYAAVVPRFLHALLAGERPPVNGDGLQSRDFTYVENVVEANMLAARVASARGVYNVGCGRKTSIVRLAGELAALTGQPLEPRHGTALRGEVRHSLADISRARQELGYEPTVPLREGLRRLVKHTLARDPAVAA